MRTVPRLAFRKPLLSLQLLLQPRERALVILCELGQTLQICHADIGLAGQINLAQADFSERECLARNELAGTARLTVELRSVATQ